MKLRPVILLLFLLTILSAEMKSIIIQQADGSKYKVNLLVNGIDSVVCDDEGYVLQFSKRDSNWHYTDRDLIINEIIKNNKRRFKFSKPYLNNDIYGEEIDEDYSYNLFKNSTTYFEHYYRILIPGREDLFSQSKVNFNLAIKSNSEIEFEEPILIPESKVLMKNYIIENYPSSALKSRATGWVKVKFLISEDGNPIFTKILKERPKGKGFGKVAQKAVERLGFIPYHQNNVPSAFYGTITIYFK